MRYMTRKEYDKVYLFLAGLNKELDEVRGRILGQKPLPSLREVFLEIRREESRRRVMLQRHKPKTNLEIQSLALITRGRGGCNHVTKRNFKRGKKP